MESGFSNRTDWLAPTLAFVIWAAHFALVWAASIVFPGAPLARWIAAALTLASFAGLFALWRWRGVETAFSAAGLGIVLAAGGVAYDTVPALIG